MTKLKKNKFCILESMHSIRCKHQNKPLITFCSLPSTSVGPRVGQRQKDQRLGVGQVEGAMDTRKEVHPMVCITAHKGKNECSQNYVNRGLGGASDSGRNGPRLAVSFSLDSEQVSSIL